MSGPSTGGPTSGTSSGPSPSPASTDDAGIVELATQGEVDTGTDAERVLTPATLAGTSRLFAPSLHAAAHGAGGGDEVGGGALATAFSPTIYTPTGATIDGNLEGLDDYLASIQQGAEFHASDGQWTTESSVLPDAVTAFSTNGNSVAAWRRDGGDMIWYQSFYAGAGAPTTTAGNLLFAVPTGVIDYTIYPAKFTSGTNPILGFAVWRDASATPTIKVLYVQMDSAVDGKIRVREDDDTILIGNDIGADDEIAFHIRIPMLSF